MNQVYPLAFLLLLNSLEIIGFYSACDYEDDGKNILWRIKYLSLKYLGDYWTKPVCGCPVCMSSLHSFVIWGFIYYFLPFAWLMIPVHMVYVFALCGFNKLIISKFEI